MDPRQADELARARLAFVSAGRPPLCGPRRAAVEAEPVPAPSTELLEPLSARVSGSGLPPRRPLTLKHLWVVAVLLLCGVGVAVAALARSSATEIPLAPVSVSAAPQPPTPSPGPPVMLRVHVAGAVVQPGVVSLAEGSIVQDAIAAAGGLDGGADPAQLNLAAPVSDGMQILIGTEDQPQGEVHGPAATSGGGSEGDGAVDLNSASASELESLPGIGPVTAGSIVAWREENGGFTVIEELQEVSGIGPKTFEKLRALVRV
ncbi:ComEA family DNA-binding protein [Tessaracoccus sp. Z1128]